MCAVTLGLAVALLVGPAGPKEAASAEGGTTYSFSGYIKTDMIFNPGYDGGDSFYATAITLGSDDADQSVGFSVRQSRIRFDSKTDTALGALSTRIETDFLGRDRQQNPNCACATHTANSARCLWAKPGRSWATTIRTPSRWT